MADGMISVGLYNSANASCSDNFGNALVSTFSPAQCPFVLGPISAEVYPYKIRYRTDSAWVGGDIHVKFTVDGNVLFSQTLTSAMITASDGVRTDWQIVDWPLHSMISMSVGPASACEDEKSYTDQYLITLNGFYKDGTPVTLTKTITLNGGSDYTPLGFSGQTNWYKSLGGINRATVRALNGSSKNGQLAIYAGIFQVSVNLFGLITDTVGTLFDTALVGRFDLKECELYGRPIADDGIGFQQGADDKLSYGLQNIRERVEDMAGTIKIRTAPLS